MTDSYMRYDVRDGVATLAMDRPPVNALDFRMMDDILVALRQAGNDPEVRAAVTDSSSEKAFCAGLDLKAVQDVWWDATRRSTCSSTARHSDPKRRWTLAL